VDEILRKVSQQCEPLRQENAELKRQVQGEDAAEKALRLRVTVLQLERDAALDDAGDLRRQVQECAGQAAELELLREVQGNLLQRPDLNEVSQLSESLIATLEQLHQRQADVEALERAQAEMRKELEALRAGESQREEHDRLIEVQTRLIETLEADVEALRLRLQDEKAHALDLQRRLDQGPDAGARRQEIATLRDNFVRLYEEAERGAFDSAEQFEQLADEAVTALDQIRDLPAYDPQRRPTGRTLGQLLDEGKAFLVVEGAGGVNQQAEPVVGAGGTPGHFMTPEDEALRGMLAKANSAQHGSGLFRVRVVLDDNSELLLQGLAPQKVGPSRQPELVLDLASGRYSASAGSLPQRHLGQRGTLVVTLYNAQRQLGETRRYGYTLEGCVSGACVVKFDDGALMYASQQSAALYRLDFLVVPLVGQ
jgi:hypothetical protein